MYVVVVDTYDPPRREWEAGAVCNVSHSTISRLR